MRQRERSRDQLHHCKFLTKQQFLVVLFDKNKKEICLQLSVLSQPHPCIYHAKITDKNIPSVLELVCPISLEAIFGQIQKQECSDLRFFLNPQNCKIGIAIEVELFGKEVKRDVYLETLVCQPIYDNQIEAKLQEMLKIQREHYQRQIKQQREEFQKLMQRDRENEDYIMHLGNIKRHLEKSLKEIDQDRKSEMAALQKQLETERRQRRQQTQSVAHRLQLLQKGFNQRLSLQDSNSEAQIRINTVLIDQQTLQNMPKELTHTLSGYQFITSTKNPSSEIFLKFTKSSKQEWEVNKTPFKCVVLRTTEELNKIIRGNLKKQGDQGQFIYNVQLNFNQVLQDEQPYRFYIGMANRQQLEELQKQASCPNPLEQLQSMMGMSFQKQQVAIILNGKKISRNQTIKTIRQATLKFKYANKEGEPLLRSFRVVANQRESDQYQTQTSKEGPNRSTEEHIPFVYFLDSFIQYHIEKY